MSKIHVGYSQALSISCVTDTQMVSKLFDQLDNQEINSYTSGDYASHGEQMLHCE